LSLSRTPRPPAPSTLFPYTTLFRSYGYIFEMDADFSHSPNDLPRLRAACESSGGHLSVGSRYIRGGRVENWPFLRIAMSYLASRSEEHTSELQSRENLVCRLLLEKK